MSAQLDELYLTWLYRQIDDVEVANPTRTHWKLIKKLYTTEFFWFIPNDDNRCGDGVELRYEFIEDLGLDDVDPHWLDIGCSMLEMLIALSRRLAFHGEGQPRDWFWEMIENIGLRSYTDSAPFPNDTIEEVLNTVIWRTYNRNGTGGGLFPLRRATHDQRDVELWYQLNAYLVERR